MKKELTYLETLKLISEAKQCFERQLEKRLNLIKVPAPLFVKTSTGLQDDLTGIEKAIGFVKEGEEFEIVHSLAKWKREALGRYDFPKHSGLYVDMKAIRKDEVVDKIHSMYVEQWDWEIVIDQSDRNLEYLKSVVKSIYKALRQTLILLKQKYHFLDLDLPKTISFITSQELEDLYPDKLPEEREKLIVKEKKAVFLIGIGNKLKSGIPHDVRSPDYDDWDLNGDILIYDKEIDMAVEISSMGIRVDEKSLLSQLEKADSMQKKSLQYHQKLLNKQLPYTIGGGIGQSRVLMLLLGKHHIAEVQASSWDNRILERTDIKIL